MAVPYFLSHIFCLAGRRYQLPLSDGAFLAYLTISAPRRYFGAFLIAPIFLLKGVQHWLKGELRHKT